MISRFLKNLLSSLSITFKTMIGIAIGPLFERYYLCIGRHRYDVIWDDSGEKKRPINIQKDTFYRCWENDKGVLKILNRYYIPHNVSRDGFITLYEYVYKHYGIYISTNYGEDTHVDNFVMIDDAKFKVLYSYYSYDEQDIKLVLYDTSMASYRECLVSIKSVSNTRIFRNETIDDILDGI